MPQTILSDARTRFHAELLDNGILGLRSKAGQSHASNADGSNKPSCDIADDILRQLATETGREPRETSVTAQGAGTRFEQAVCKFVDDTFPKLSHLRPGDWIVADLGNRNAIKESTFAQYRHLAGLEEAIREKKLETDLGRGYVIAPDVVVARRPVTDEKINAPFLPHQYVSGDQPLAAHADLRRGHDGTKPPILLADISVKWTMRSDRAQNSRTEALNLIRSRKGPTPHIVVVTGEPLPSRIASLALGTGDIDMVYHAFLPELVKAVHGLKDRQDIAELVDELVEGDRLRDISDLPLDLAV